LPNLDPGASYTVLFPEFAEKEGSTLEGSIVLCTENDLGGQCRKNLIVFIPTVEENISFESPEALLSPDIFKVDYVGVVHPSQCPETWWLRVNLTNKSAVTLKSMSISVTDTTTNENAQSTGNTNIFSDEDQSVCNPGVDISDAQGVPDLVANASFTVSSGKLTKDPTGHTLAVTIKLCTEENLTGECSEKTANFTPGITAVATVDTTKPTFPFIILSEGTNCRTGPGTEYSLIGAYTAETKIPVLGKDSTGRYWIVASPNVGEPNIKCWLIGDYVKESGNVNNVEIYPVPPTPTPRIPTSTPTTTPTSTPTSTPTP
jgi:hypothetical protein